MTLAWWRRPPTQTPPADLPPITKWHIEADLPNGGQFTLTGLVYPEDDETLILAIADALADGLRRAGFPTETTITRETKATR